MREHSGGIVALGLEVQSRHEQQRRHRPRVTAKGHADQWSWVLGIRERGHPCHANKCSRILGMPGKHGLVARTRIGGVVSLEEQIRRCELPFDHRWIGRGGRVEGGECVTHGCRL